MNTETLDLLDRPFGEIVDDLLTAVVGGVVNEPLIYDDRNLRYPLAEPATAIRGVTGNSPGRPRAGPCSSQRSSIPYSGVLCRR
jgi:hypothetical protein